MAAGRGGRTLLSTGHRSGQAGGPDMRALAFLLGARAIDIAAQRSRRPGRRVAPGLPPIAATADQARAWRQWAGVASDDEQRVRGPLRRAARRGAI